MTDAKTLTRISEAEKAYLKSAYYKWRQDYYHLRFQNKKLNPNEMMIETINNAKQTIDIVS